jgi:hypothetical protein
MTSTPPPSSPPPQGPAGYGPPPSPPPPPGPGGYGPPALPPLERLRVAYQRRHESDYIFSFWTALGWTVLTLGIFSLYVIYQLVRRSRDHNRRRLDLLDAAAAASWEQAGSRELKEELRPNFERLSGHLAVMRQMTTDFREPIVWMVLAILVRGLTDLVAFILLDQDLCKHGRADYGAEAELSTIYGRLGCELPGPDPAQLKGSHNYAGRVVAAVFSLGFYMLWWTADIMREANRHFEANWTWEDWLARAATTV